MLSIRAPNSRDFARDEKDFFTSWTWLYLTHRYPREAQRNLLRMLTLSGLDVQWWPGCSMALTTMQGWGRALPPFSGEQRAALGETAWLAQRIKAVWAWAEAEGVPVGEPSRCPTYLLAYGYTQDAYLWDLTQVYGQSMARRYAIPWPETPSQSQRPSDAFNFMQQAVAIMGETAGAIERLMTSGGHDGDRDR